MNKKIQTKLFSSLGVILACTHFSVQAVPITLNLTSGINGNTYTVQGETGTAGTLGTDYALGSYLAGGNGGLGHGFPDRLAWTEGFVAPAPPSGTSAEGALEALDHNWLQGRANAIIVDLGDGNASDQAIVFNSTDHLAVDIIYNDPEKDLWNKFVEGIEFTVYGTNDLADALLAGLKGGVFGNTEEGSVPDAGPGSTFEQGKLAFVFEDGWHDFGNIDEGDDFASVWQFSQDYRYIAVYSSHTDPLVGDGFRSDDNELDAIGSFLKDVGIPPTGVPEPTSFALFALGLAGFGIYGRGRCKSNWKKINASV